MLIGMLPRDYDIALKAAENKKKYGHLHVLSSKYKQEKGLQSSETC